MKQMKQYSLYTKVNPEIVKYSITNPGQHPESKIPLANPLTDLCQGSLSNVLSESSP